MSFSREGHVGAAGYSRGMISPASPPPFLRRTASPIGRILLTSDGDRVTSVVIARAGALPLEDLPERTTDVLERAATQLAEYFAGERTDFDVPLALEGTPFQRAVWERLARVRYGEVTTYGELGRGTGRATAGRAVGGAVGANPVPILVPCHRVLASNGRITGYSAGDGVPTKAWLLEHEGVGLHA